MAVTSYFVDGKETVVAETVQVRAGSSHEHGGVDLQATTLLCLDAAGTVRAQFLLNDVHGYRLD